MKATKTPTTGIIFVLGRSVVTLIGDDVIVADGTDMPAAVAKAATDYRIKRVALVWEPFGLTHVQVVCPLVVNRTIFAKLSDVKREYASVVSDTQGWGIEKPKPVSGAAYTLLHAETVPGLADTQSLLAGAGVPAYGAWSLYSVLAAVVGKNAGKEATGSAVVVVNNFAAVFTFGGPRPVCQTWDLDDPVSIQQIKDTLIEQGWPNKTRRLNGWRLLTNTQPDKLGAMFDSANNVWSEALGSIPRISFTDVSAAAAKLPRSQTTNMLEAFPRQFPLGQWILAGAAAAALVAVILAGAWGLRFSHAAKASAELTAQKSALEAQEDKLKANSDELAKLEKENGEKAVPLPKGRAKMLRELTASIPDEFSLNNLIVRDDGQVSLTAWGVGDGAKAVRLGVALKAYGLQFSPEKMVVKQDASDGKDQNSDTLLVTVDGTWQGADVSDKN